jgi:TatD DNase family protein
MFDFVGWFLYNDCIVNMIDTHAHLNHENLFSNRHQIVLDAISQGVDGIVCVGFDLPSSISASQIANEFENINAVVGVHPHEAKTYSPQVEQQLEQLAKNKRVVAIGEIGLDFFYDFSPREIQQQVFKAQIKLAHKLGLPIVIHTRDAMDLTLQILQEHKQYLTHGGVMHCFDGTYEQAQKAIELGFLLGLGGMITFKKNYDYLPKIPLNKIVLETDCPYLAPVPFRGKTNLPQYTAQVCKHLALVMGKTEQEIDNITTQNAKKVFNI